MKCYNKIMKALNAINNNLQTYSGIIVLIMYTCWHSFFEIT